MLQACTVIGRRTGLQDMMSDTNPKTSDNGAETANTSASSRQIPTLATPLESTPQKRFEDLPAAAQRALAEAEARRKDIDKKQKRMAREIDGRGGLEPTRYDDWEIKGITVDF